MSVNKALPHIFVLPEDDANRQLALGFHLSVDKIRQIQVLKVAGGWREVLNVFESVHITEMGRNPNRFMVLLIDFDGNSGRGESARALIPETLRDRVFVLGALTRPEDLRQALRSDNLKSYEQIGSALADDCRNDTATIWDHNLLRQNLGEVDRLRSHVRDVLFI